MDEGDRSCSHAWKQLRAELYGFRSSYQHSSLCWHLPRYTHTGHLHGVPSPTHKSMETQYVYSMHVNAHGKVDSITKVWHSAWAAAQVGWTLPTTVPADAEHLFHACESGKGWHECMHYCAHDDVFSAQAEPLKDIRTVYAYTEWMRGIAVVAMPGSTYELNAQSLDPKTGQQHFSAPSVAHTLDIFMDFQLRHTNPWRPNMSTTCTWRLVEKWTESQRCGTLHGLPHKWVGHRLRVSLQMLSICSMPVKAEEGGRK
eukprot:TRINITY_DN13117_c0_g1_i3.p1 TRINITY_DN13117_c0_g1~~TRINITY_DN13117_c0_g1_i3.p1  ORF type:complete len:257 (-),score=36.23 TRINITY_DN13117_c0_g1_i3:89-859(-)